MRTQTTGKLYCPDAQVLQDVADRIINEFSPDCRVSQVKPADRGDYHIMITIYREAQR